MKVQAIVNRLNKRGVTFRVYAGELQWAPGKCVVSKADLVALQDASAELKAIVRQMAADRHEPISFAAYAERRLAARRGSDQYQPGAA